MGIIKLDFDRITKRVSNFVLSLPKPYEVRIGFHGFNLRKVCNCLEEVKDASGCYNCWLYGYDDPNRLKINRAQKLNGLPNNVLWDIKRGQKKPGEWELIENSADADRFLRKFTGFY